MGLRIALGARRPQIVRLVLTRAMRPVMAGIACGLLLSIVVGRLVASMLYGTSATNPFVLGAAAAALMITGLLGSLVPSVRAIRVDPAVALRAE
jgi:ABC-type antimicrobial peptide transport system permease subunit